MGADSRRTVLPGEGSTETSLRKTTDGNEKGKVYEIKRLAFRA